jgi:PAS domain S-box-containing protein
MIETHQQPLERSEKTSASQSLRALTSKTGQTTELLCGGGEIAALIKQHNWERTALGSIGGWSPILKATAALILQSPVPIVLLWGKEGFMIYNDAYSKVAGARHPSLLGSKVREGWPEIAEFNDHVMRVGLAGGILQYRDQELILQRNGAAEQVWMNLDCSPVLDEHGEPAGVMAIVVETTDRVLAERRIESTLLDERATSELREQFIAVLGHDLRNPLQAIFAAGDLLERKLTEPALRDTAARIKTNVRRMSALIDDVLDFARGKLGGGMGVQIQEIADMDIALKSIVRELQDVQPTRRIFSDIDVTGIVRCDIARVQQVASNLIGNALTHGALSSPVKFVARCDEENFILEVWNDGDAIPQESIGKIFEPFWRHATASHRQGLGLGLHICSQIVRAHGGALTVVSTPETGTQFTARLPLRKSGASLRQ